MYMYAMVNRMVFVIVRLDSGTMRGETDLTEGPAVTFVAMRALYVAQEFLAQLAVCVWVIRVRGMWLHGAETAMSCCCPTESAECP